MRMSALVFAAFVAGVAALPAQAAPYTFYSERQQGETLIIEHTPAPGIVAQRTVRRGTAMRRHAWRRHHRHHHRRSFARGPSTSRSIAGFCRDGGPFVRPDVLGRPTVLQREVCDSVAYYSLNPNNIVARPNKPFLR